jgi:hypothetical protein
MYIYISLLFLLLFLLLLLLLLPHLSSAQGKDGASPSTTTVSNEVILF